METKQTKEYLRYTFSEDEKKGLSVDLVNCIRKKTGLENELKTISQQYKADVQGQESMIQSVTNKLDAGYEMRTVDCEWRYDFEVGEKSLWRMDTGEMVRQDKITQDEAQGALL